MSKPLTIAINAQIVSDGRAGGIFQFTSYLIRGLAQLEDGEEEYIVIGPASGEDWVTPLLSPNMKLVRPPAGQIQESRWSGIGRLKKYLGPLHGPTRTVYRWLRPTREEFFDAFGADLVHFPYQHFQSCRVPTVFNPHDLQHCHFPKFFTRADLATRSTTYREACCKATAIAVVGGAGKQDVVKQYGIDPGKVVVIPVGPPVESIVACDDALLGTVQAALELPKKFALYPAQTWAHKNHLRLLEALALLRDEFGLRIPLVCTGFKSDFWPTIERRMAKLRLGDQVRFLGYVSDKQLTAVSRMADFVVYPSLFEGGSFPMMEAFQNGIPMTSSNVTTLPEYGGDAVLFFDPLSTTAIAAAVRRMWEDADLRETLRRNGREQIKAYSWKNTARAYRALYRRVAGRVLNEQDQEILKLESASAIT